MSGLTEYYKGCRWPKTGRSAEPEPAPPRAREKGPQAKARQRKKLAQIRTKREMREHVLALDGERCRWPDCECHGELEVAHFVAEGAGGDPMLNRYVPENLITLCKVRHRTGARSLHSGFARMEPLTEKGMRGPVLFLELEKAEPGRWFVVGVTEPPRD